MLPMLKSFEYQWI